MLGFVLTLYTPGRAVDAFLYKMLIVDELGTRVIVFSLKNSIDCPRFECKSLEVNGFGDESYSVAYV